MEMGILAHGNGPWHSQGPGVTSLHLPLCIRALGEGMRGWQGECGRGLLGQMEGRGCHHLRLGSWLGGPDPMRGCPTLSHPGNPGKAVVRQLGVTLDQLPLEEPQVCRGPSCPPGDFPKYL